MFIGIWNFADDAGRHPWSIKQIKAEIFPAETVEPKYILEWLQELETNGLIKRYVYDNTDYFYITGWAKHQRIDKPHKPKYPDPFDDNSTNVPRTLPPDKIRYDKTREDKKVVEVAPKALPSKGSRLPEGWLPSLEGKSFADKKIGAERAIEELDKFRDYWISVPGARGLKLDWQRTWLNWIRNSHGGANGYRGSRSLQDDAKSVSAASRRLEEAAKRGEFTIKPRPSLYPESGPSHIRLLPKG
jgi:hypothetical protein